MVFATEKTIKDGLSINMLVGFGNDDYRQRYHTSLWQICVQSKKLSEETVCCAKIHKS